MYLFFCIYYMDISFEFYGTVMCYVMQLNMVTCVKFDSILVVDNMNFTELWCYTFEVVLVPDSIAICIYAIPHTQMFRNKKLINIYQ